MIEKFNSNTKNLVLKKENKLHTWNEGYAVGHINVSRAQYHPKLCHRNIKISLVKFVLVLFFSTWRWYQNT